MRRAVPLLLTALCSGCSDEGQVLAAGLDDSASLVQLQRHEPDRSAAAAEEALLQSDLDEALAGVSEAKIRSWKNLVREVSKRGNLSRELRGFVMLEAAGRIMEGADFVTADGPRGSKVRDDVNKEEDPVDEFMDDLENALNKAGKAAPSDTPTSPWALLRKWREFQQGVSQPVSCVRTRVNLLVDVAMIGATASYTPQCEGSRMCASDAMDLIKYVGYVVRDTVDGMSHCSDKMNPQILCNGATVGATSQLLGVVSSSVGLSYKCDPKSYKDDLLEGKTTLGIETRIFRCSVDISRGFGYLLLYLWRLYRGLDPNTKGAGSQSPLAYHLQAASAATWFINAVLAASTGCPEGQELKWACAKEATEVAAYLANMGASLERAHDFCLDKYGNNKRRSGASDDADRQAPIPPPKVGEPLKAGEMLFGDSPKAKAVEKDAGAVDLLTRARKELEAEATAPGASSPYAGAVEVLDDDDADEVDGVPSDDESAPDKSSDDDEDESADDGGGKDESPPDSPDDETSGASDDDEEASDDDDEGADDDDKDESPSDSSDETSGTSDDDEGSDDDDEGPGDDEDEDSDDDSGRPLDLLKVSSDDDDSSLLDVLNPDDEESPLSILNPGKRAPDSPLGELTGGDDSDNPLEMLSGDNKKGSPLDMLSGDNKKGSPLDMLSGDDDSVNPLDMLSGDDDSVNPLDMLSGDKDKSSPLDMLSGDDDSVNPLDMLSGDKDKGSPLDLLSGDDDSGNPLEMLSGDDDSGSPLDMLTGEDSPVSKLTKNADPSKLLGSLGR